MGYLGVKTCEFKVIMNHNFECKPTGLRWHPKTRGWVSQQLDTGAKVLSSLWSADPVSSLQTTLAN